MDKLKDVDVIEKHVACDEHAASVETVLVERRVAYTIEDEWQDGCDRCGKTGMNRRFLVVDGKGLTRLDGGKKLSEILSESPKNGLASA